MIYTRNIPVEFCHCDPAGIVFYPRYFEMANSVIENFFLEVVRYPFARIMAEGLGIPTVRAQMDFRAPSRLGDRLDWRLQVGDLGRASARMDLSVPDRLAAQMTLCWLNTEFRPAPWPEEIRKVLEDYR